MKENKVQICSDLQAARQGGQAALCSLCGAESRSGTRAGNWRAAAAARGWIKCQNSKGVYQAVIHYVRDTDTMHGSDFTFMGLWHALQ